MYQPKTTRAFKMNRRTLSFFIRVTLILLYEEIILVSPWGLADSPMGLNGKFVLVAACFTNINSKTGLVRQTTDISLDV